MRGVAQLDGARASLEDGGDDGLIFHGVQRARRIRHVTADFDERHRPECDPQLDAVQ